MFPWRVAFKMPVFLFGKVHFRDISGSMIIEGRVSPGMITIGREGYYVASSKPYCQWTVQGKIVFKGPVRFGGGSYVMVSKGAILSIGSRGTYVGSNSVIICFNKIEIGDSVDLAWECQVIDTSFHYIESIHSDNAIKPLTKPVYIGDRVWVGNRTTISKGSIIPSDNIIASNSLVNRDFSNEGSFNLFAGIPAVVKKKGISRIRDKREKELDTIFDYTRTHL